jgi:hypothetical protein
MLSASASLGTVNFLQASTWRILTARAGLVMNVLANVTTTGGNMELEGNADAVASVATVTMRDLTAHSEAVRIRRCTSQICR